MGQLGQLRVLVTTKVFENYGDSKQPHYRAKYGDTYECILPDDMPLMNAVVAIMAYIATKDSINSAEYGSRGQHSYREFPVEYETIPVGMLTQDEISWASGGDVYPITKLKMTDGFHVVPA